MLIEKIKISMIGIIFLIVFPSYGIGGGIAEFGRTYVYRFIPIEKQSTLINRAILETKKYAASTIKSSVREYMKQKYGNQQFTDQQLQALIFLGAKVKTTDVELKALQYMINVRVFVAPEVIDNLISGIKGELVANDVLKLIDDYDKNNNRGEKLRQEYLKNNSESAKDNTRASILNNDNNFISLDYLERGLEQFLLQNYQKSVELLSKSISLNDRYIMSYQYRAKGYELKKEDALAVQDYTTILSLQEDAVTYNNLGMLYSNKKQYDKAIENLTKAILLDDKFDIAFNNRGTVYYNKGDYQLAIMDFKSAIRVNPSFDRAYYNCGYIYFKQVDYNNAITYLTKAIQLNRNYAEAYAIRGISYINIGNIEPGWLDIGKSCNIGYEDACRYTYEKAWTFYERGQIDAAYEIVKKYAKKDDERSDILLGLIYVYQKRPKEALQIVEKYKPLFEAALRKITESSKPDTFLTAEEIERVNKYYYHILFISGAANYEVDNCKEAINDLTKYAKEHSDLDSNNMLGICYYKLKKYQEAMRPFQKIFEMSQDGSVKAMAAYSIASLSALLGRVDDTTQWLSVLLKYKDHDHYLQKIKTDNDFDGIRNDNQFENFIRSIDKLNVQ